MPRGVQVLEESGGARKIPGGVNFAMDGVGLFLLPYGVGRLVHGHRITGGLVLTQGRGLVEDVYEGVGDSVVNDVHEGVDEEGGWGHPGEPLSGSLVQLRLPSLAPRGQGEGMTAPETTLGWLLGARRGKTTLATFFSVRMFCGWEGGDNWGSMIFLLNIIRESGPGFPNQ